MNTNCRLLGREESEESEIHDFWTFACSDFHRYLLFHEYLIRKGTFNRGSFAKKQKFKLLDILMVHFFFKFLYYFFFCQKTTITSNNLLFCLIIINCIYFNKSNYIFRTQAYCSLRDEILTILDDSTSCTFHLHRRTFPCQYSITVINSFNRSSFNRRFCKLDPRHCTRGKRR